MKYTKPIDLHLHGEAVLSGEIKLQRGQWVKCGNGLSRYVGINQGRTIWVAHSQGNSKDTAQRFKELCEIIN